ncbi:hypothetical protein ACFL59_16435, partial [Planctomycetota bacterium]
ITGYVRADDGVSVTLCEPAGAPAVPLLTAGAALGRIFCGEKRADPDITKAVALLRRYPPTVAQAEPAYWFLGTYALFQATRLDSEGFSQWSQALLPTLVERQIKTGDNAGSWDPTGIHGDLGGRAAVTATCLLAQQIRYRYERVKKARDEENEEEKEAK